MPFDGHEPQPQGWSEHRSACDASINFERTVANGKFEARFVRRTQDYFIAYLSSQSGCNRACRMCHLTATMQTGMDQALRSDFVEQAEIVFQHYRNNEPAAERVHFNWMARGEPLLNPAIVENWPGLSQDLAAIAQRHGLQPVFNISTIFPSDFKGDLKTVFAGPHRPVIYYSLYSLSPTFRKRWLPKARDPEIVLARLTEWQRQTGGEVVLHWALIAGENASEQDADGICHAVRRHGLAMKFNLVRYNPYNDGRGAEPDEADLDRYFKIMASAATVPGSRIVPRVGFDVKASCGMFVGKDRDNSV